MGQTFWLDIETITYKPFIYIVLYVSTGFVDIDLVVYLLFLWCLGRVSDWPYKNWHTRTRTQTPTLNSSKSAEIKKKYQRMGLRFLAVCLCRLCISSYSPECVARVDPSLGIDYPPQNYHVFPSLHHHHHHHYHYHHYYHYYYYL